MPINEHAIRKLRSRLPRGFQRIVAQRLCGRYSTSYIAYVANGQRSNEQVLQALIACAQEEEARKRAAEKAISQL